MLNFYVFEFFWNQKNIWLNNNYFRKVDKKLEKLVKFDENLTFQFLTNFTKIALVSLIMKSMFYNASLWKTGKFFIFWGAEFVKIWEQLIEI